LRCGLGEDGGCGEQDDSEPDLHSEMMDASAVKRRNRIPAQMIPF
jgi:hypothetical protein